MGSRHGRPRREEDSAPPPINSRLSSSARSSPAGQVCPICQNSPVSASSGSRCCCCCQCNRRCCADCVVKKRFASSAAPGLSSAKVAVCKECDGKLNVVSCLPRTAWLLIQEYCPDDTRQQLLQLCHATQLGVLLPYRYGRFGWGSFFTEKTFLSKGANGAVFKTHLRDDIPEELWETQWKAGLPHKGGHRNPSSHATPVSSAREEGRYPTPVAIKTIQKASVFSTRKWSHIHREVEALRRCQHPHVVRLLFVAQGPSEVYIALQYVEGGDLFDWLVRQQVPSEEDVGVVARQLLSTLHYLHEECGVVHRDIKPENILLDTGVVSDSDNNMMGDDDAAADGSRRLYIRLADFGYAKILPQPEKEGSPTSPGMRALSALDPAALPPIPLAPRSNHADGHHTSAGGGSRGWEDRTANSAVTQQQRGRARHAMVSVTPCGTLGFAAPEILAAYNVQKEAYKSPPSPDRGNDGGNEAGVGGGPPTPINLIKRMDIFAAGVTIAILLTGCEPFPCFSSREHLEAVQGGVDFSGPQWRYVSKPARRLLRMMMAPRAADRPSALECLHSRWLEQYTQHTASEEWNQGDNDGNLLNHSGGAAAAREQMTRSFRNSVRSLRKNDGWLFVQDAAGVVATAPRELVEVDGGDQFSPNAVASTGDGRRAGQ